MKYIMPFLESVFHSSLFYLHLSFGLYSIINILDPFSNKMASLIRIIVSLFILLIFKLRKTMNKNLLYFISILILLLTYFFEYDMKNTEAILLTLLQIKCSQRIKNRGFILFIQSVFLITLYRLDKKAISLPFNLLAHFFIFFSILVFIKYPKEKASEKIKGKKLEYKKSLAEFHEKIDILIKKTNSNFLNSISDALILFNPRTKIIDYLNSKANHLFPSSVHPSKIDDLPSWPLYSEISSISNSMRTNTVFLPKLLDSDEYTSFSYLTKIENELCSLSVFKISHSLSIIVITPSKNINESNNTKMLSYVTHELRTPLNCINTMLDALMRSASQELRESYIIPARDSLGCLLALINDLLDMSQIMAGKFSLSLCDFKINNVMRDVIKLMTLQAELKEVKIIFEESKDLPYEVNSDPARLRQVLINLLSNAMKYTSFGWIKLKLSYIRSNIYEISVSDTGLGIKKEDLAKLFLDFGRIKNAEDHSLNNYGVGLGLVISDALAKELGGEEQGLQIESVWGKGTTFKFHLRDFNETDCRLKEVECLPSIPILDTKKTEQSMTQTPRTQTIRRSITFNLFSNPDAGSDEEKLRKDCDCKEILICDDSPFNILALKFQLKNIGKDCDTASMGEAALINVKEKLKSRCCKFYKFIFMDLVMPVMDGFETSKKIKETLNAFAGNTKIIAFSGYDAIVERRKALKAGMEGFLVKPVMEKELNKLIEFGKQGSQRNIKSEEIEF